MRFELVCDWCGARYERYRKSRFNFCSRACLGSFSSKSKNPDRYRELRDLTAVSKHMTELNARLNPTRMTEEVKAKLRAARLDSGEGKGYRKVNGRHEHRTVAEQMLGRPLEPGEIVHHIDRNKRNNAPENLQVMTQSEHARLHAQEDRT